MHIYCNHNTVAFTPSSFYRDFMETILGKWSSEKGGRICLFLCNQKFLAEWGKVLSD